VTIRDVMTVGYFVLAIYAFAGGVVQGYVIFPDWKLISTEDFPAVHKSMVRRQIIYVPFVVLSVLVNLIMIWFHPPSMTTALVVIAAALQLFIIVVTGTLIVPIHKQLDQAKSSELIDRLVTYHVSLRAIPGTAVMVVTIMMLYQVVRAASS
jgi:hypothetical protein